MMQKTKKPENGTKFVPNPRLLPEGQLVGWRAQNTVLSFVRTLLGLSRTEGAILDALLTYQMPQTAAKIAKKANVNRQMTNRILKDFESRKIVLLFEEAGRRDRWSYNRKVGRLALRLFVR